MKKEVTAHRLAAYSDAVFAVIVTVMVLGLRAPDEPAFSALWPLWPTAISYAMSYLFIAIMDKPPLPDAVRRSSDVETDVDQLLPSLHGVAPAFCDCVDSAHHTRVIPCRVLRRAIRVRRYCLQLFRE